MPEWFWPWHAEIEKFPSAVMAARHPDSINLGDVSAKDFAQRAADIARPDVLVFGSPCQSFSVAGRRLGLDDPRGNMALLALGVVDRLKPRWFVFENVPGLMSSDGGRDFGTFLRFVDDIGYCCAWTRLDAQHFGLAQRRDRLFIVGHSGDWRGPAAVLLEPESMRGNNPPSRRAGERTPSSVEARTNGGGSVAFGGNNTAGEIDVATACRAKGGTGHGDFESETFVVADPISAHEQKTYTHEGKNNFRLRNVVPSAVRRLTPRECERLMGFPDDYTAIRFRGKPAADGPRYKALGNSIAVPVMRWVLNRIDLWERLQQR